MLNQNIAILKKLYKKRKHILVMTLGSIIVAFVFCRIVTPVYKSTAFVYPANLSVYGEESQTEQLLQFFQSTEVRQYIWRKFHLAKHYHIDTMSRIYPFQYDEIYEKKISIAQTKYESIEIKVEDSNPDTARMLAAGVIEAVNWLIEKEHREKYMETIKNAKVYLDLKKHEVDSTQKLLAELSEKYGLLNVNIQLKEAAKNQYKMWAGGGKNAELTNLVESMKKFGAEHERLALYFDDQLRGWAWATNEYQKRMAEFNHHNTFTSLASRPTQPVVASWPRRSLIMAVTGLAVFTLCCLYFIFIDRFRSIYDQITSEK